MKDQLYRLVGEVTADKYIEEIEQEQGRAASTLKRENKRSNSQGRRDLYIKPPFQTPFQKRSHH